MKRQWIAAVAVVGLLQPGIFSESRKHSSPFQSKLRKDQEALHALNRLTFGPRPGDIERVKKIGVKKWIDRQLHPERLNENPVLDAKLAPLETLRLEQQELTEKYPPPQKIVAVATGRAPLPEDPEIRERYQRLIARYKDRIEKRTGKEVSVPEPATTPAAPARQRARLTDASPEGRRAMLADAAPQQVVLHDLLEGKIYRAVYSERQLEEVLVDFWFNHFNVYLDKGADRFLTTSYERDAIRPHVLGKFSDLLRDTAQHPAMLWYLDNWQSVSPESVMGRRSLGNRKRGLNENYARELLELHTMGVDGGYTQKDIIEVARCFTGWTIRDPRVGAGFEFNPRTHDPGEKVVLGNTIPAGGGMEDGLKVLDILTHHASTGRFISKKLAQRFIADNPPDAVVTSMSATFTKTGGDLREVMRTMLASKEFWSQGAYRAKVKSPLEMVASAARATDADIRSAFGLAQKIGDLGQPLYRKQEPTGYSNTSEEWVNSAALLARMNFALALTQNKLPGVHVDTARLEGHPHVVAAQLLFSEPTSQTRDAIERGLAEKKDDMVIAGFVIGSPEFQRR